MKTRKCHRCKTEFPATTEFFVGDRTRLLGISYECRSCHSERKRGRDRRKERWSKLTPEQKLRRKAAQKKYSRTLKGRAIHLRKAYEKIDACDFTTDEIVEIIKKPCHYCGTTEDNRGLDRIDNDLPHIKGNVLPACRDCNFARGDRFTLEEMERIGKVIREIKRDRLAMEVESDNRQEN